MKPLNRETGKPYHGKAVLMDEGIAQTGNSNKGKPYNGTKQKRPYGKTAWRWGRGDGGGRMNGCAGGEGSVFGDGLQDANGHLPAALPGLDVELRLTTDRQFHRLGNMAVERDDIAFLEIGYGADRCVQLSERLGS